MDWIKLAVRYRDDPRIEVVATELGLGYEEALGRVIVLMLKAADHEAKYLPPSVPQATLEALRKAELVNGREWVTFDEFAMDLARVREAGRQRQKRFRDSKSNKTKTGVTRDVTSEPSVTSRDRREETRSLDKKIPPVTPPAAAYAKPAIVQPLAFSKRFEIVYKNYPKSDGKVPAWGAWQSAEATYPGGEAALYEAIRKALTWQRASAGWRREGGKFVISLERYLRERRWEDARPEIEEEA